MSRRSQAKKRIISPDLKYGSILIQKFINCVMRDGKKMRAQYIVYKALELSAQTLRSSDKSKTKENNDTPLNRDNGAFFSDVLDKARPLVEVRSKRVGGATYQVPHDVTYARGVALAMRWIVTESKKEKNKNGVEYAMANQLVQIMDSKGSVIKKREELHSMAEGNRAFSHYKW